MDESDSVLIERLASQADAEAFATLIHQYADMVFSTSRRVVGNDAQAADVAQETFFQLLKSADRVTGSVGAWLHRVATRRAVDLVRQESSRRQREDNYVRGGFLEAEQWSEVEPLVDEAMEELPEELRELLVLHFLKGKSMTEIAAEQGSSQPTISRRVAIALEQLRDRLRAKDVLVGGVFLGTMLANSTQAAPAPVLDSLGKLALALAASYTPAAAIGPSAFLATTGAKLALAAATLVMAAGATWLTLGRGTGKGQTASPSAREQAPVITTAEAAEQNLGASPENFTAVPGENPMQVSLLPNPVGRLAGSPNPGEDGGANLFGRGSAVRGTFQPGGGVVTLGSGGGETNGATTAWGGGGAVAFGSGFSFGGRFGQPSRALAFSTNYSYATTWSYSNGNPSQGQAAATSGMSPRAPSRR